MNNFQYYNPVRIVFGEGQIEQLADLVPNNARVLITYGGGSAQRTGTLDEVKTSKEAFGEAIIAQYFEQYKQRLDTIAAQDVNAQQKIYDYFKQWYDTQQYGCDEGRCLVVKLSAEVADISEPMRCALASGYHQVIAWLSTHIKAGWEDGSVPRPANIAAESLAKRWYYAWLGASLMAKTNQSNTPLAEVWQMTTTELGR